MTNSTAGKDPFSLEAGVPEIKDSLRPVPKASDRISKKVLMVFLAFVALVFVIFMFSLDSMDRKKSVKEDVKTPQKTDTKLPVSVDEMLVDPTANLKSPNENLTASLPAAFDNLVHGAESDANTHPALSGGSAKNKGSLTATTPSGVPSDIPPVPPVPPAVPAIKPLTPEEQAAIAAKQTRLQQQQAARTTGMSVKPFSTDPSGSAVMNPADLLAQSMKNAGGQAGGMGSGLPLDQSSAGSAQRGGVQEDKLQFLKNAKKSDRGYHPNIPMAALSKNEIKTGAFIPMTLETSINSDLPGQVTARVTEDVYDTVSGCRLLIPALSKVVGQYDSKISLGQGRMLVVWNSLIFPNGDELNMGAMQSYDTNGQSGFASDVNNHYFRLFGLTFGLSMITSGVTLSVPQPNPGANGAAGQQSPSQVVASGLAQQFGQLGAQIISKYMDVQPTLQNYAGERFVVMVPQTIVFTRVLRNRCGGSLVD